MSEAKAMKAFLAAKPLTAAELWQEMTDEERAGFEATYVLIAGEVWCKDDVPKCGECGAHDFDLTPDDPETGDGEMRCEPCHREHLGEVADDRSLHAWANYTKGVR